MRRPGTLLFAAVLTLLPLTAWAAIAESPAGGLGAWQRPVRGRVERPFEAPVFRYGPGHLGVDLAAAPGSPVRAAGAGVVVFAGIVAGAMHVVIGHPGDMRTSYSFLASIRVRRGEAVAAGAVIGTTGGRGEQHDGTALHLGLRVGDTYVDPMRLFAPPDLASVVHLAPTGPDAPRSGAASASLRSLGLLLPEPTRPPARPAPEQPPAGIPTQFGRRTADGAPLYPR
jgi:murein DD-endopeptidase MepM/ murein hydrolase activator NlpD